MTNELRNPNDEWRGAVRTWVTIGYAMLVALRCVRLRLRSRMSGETVRAGLATNIPRETRGLQRVLDGQSRSNRVKPMHRARFVQVVENQGRRPGESHSVQVSPTFQMRSLECGMAGEQIKLWDDEGVCRYLGFVRTSCPRSGRSWSHPVAPSRTSWLGFQPGWWLEAKCCWVMVCSGFWWFSTVQL
jgi:hypothetical protein